MNNKPLVSIALLTYNHEKYIKDCILSILEQNYTNIEIIILDDASSDSTTVIIESYLEILRKKFKDVFFIKNKTNIGNIPYNMNCMLKKSNGKYCKMLSGDDILIYNCISRLVESLLNNLQCSVVYSNGFVIQDGYKKQDRIKKTKSLYTYRKSEVEPQDFFLKLMFGNHIAAPTVMIKRELLKKYGYLDESITYEDYEYWIRLSFQNVKFYYLDDYLIYYRKAVTSISNFEKGKKNKKIEIGMLSDKKTHDKYLQYLSKENQIKCKKYYYYKYLKICWKEKYFKGVIRIIHKLKKEQIEIPWNLFKRPSLVQYEEIIEKNAMIIKMLERWIFNVQAEKTIISYFTENNIRKIGIYGLGCIANRICVELKNTNIEIKYIIDKNADKLVSDLPVVTMEEELEDIDVVIVTIAGQYDKIKKELQKKVGCKIIHIEDILFL